MEEAPKSFVYKIVILVMCLVIFLNLPYICETHGQAHSRDHDHSHGDHPHESPSFKYSREANVLKTEHETHSQGPSRETFELWSQALGSTVLISAAPFLILFLVPLDNSKAREPLLKVLLSFASGSLLGDAFLHLIPHAISPHSHDESLGHAHSHGPETHVHDMRVGFWVLFGIITFLMVEKFVRLLKGEHGHTHGHTQSKATVSEKDNKKVKKDEKNEAKDKKKENTTGGEIKVAGYLNLAADFTHNFTDGLAIGASYLAGKNIGIVTTITILLHEVPHEIGDIAILIQSGCSKKKAMLLQLTTAVGALTGTLVSLLAEGIDNTATSWILPFTAGGFIYIATVSVIPELLSDTKFWQSVKEIIALIVGVYMMVLIADYE